MVTRHDAAPLQRETEVCLLHQRPHGAAAACHSEIHVVRAAPDWRANPRLLEEIP